VLGDVSRGPYTSRRRSSMRWKWIPALVVGAIAAGSAVPAAAGWLIDQMLTGGGQSARQQIVLQANRMKSGLFGADGRPAVAFILDVAGDTITQVDYGQRQYVSASVPEYTRWMARVTQAADAQMAASMKQMEEAMKNMSPDQRKAMEQQMQR